MKFQHDPPRRANLSQRGQEILFAGLGGGGAGRGLSRS